MFLHLCSQLAEYHSLYELQRKRMEEHIGQCSTHTASLASLAGIGSPLSLYTQSER